MYPAKFDYVRAESAEQAVEMAKADDEAKFMAGGHSLIPAMKLRLAQPTKVIDISKLGMNEISGNHVGAMVTHTQIENADGLPTCMSESAGMIGDPMVRNRGTIGGNIAHADPASDYPTVLTALNATIHTTGGDHQADGFFTDLFETQLGEGELITGVTVDADGTCSAYEKLFNPASRYAMVGCAVVLKVANDQITDARVAIGGLTPMAVSCTAVADALKGESATSATCQAAAGKVADDLAGKEIMGDIHASAEYRMNVAPAIVCRAIEKALSRK